MNGIKKSPDTAQQVEVQEHPNLTPVYSQSDDIKFSQHLYNYFSISDIDKHSEKVNTELEAIVKWTGEKNLPNAIGKIKALELQLGTPPMGMTRISRLYNWAKITMEINNLTKVREVYGKL